MSTAPAISLYNINPMTIIKGDADNPLHEYLIYADDYEFFTWTDWVNDTTSSPDNNQLTNAAEFDPYVLKVKCTFTKEGDACAIGSSKCGA